MPRIRNRKLSKRVRETVQEMYAARYPHMFDETQLRYGDKKDGAPAPAPKRGWFGWLWGAAPSPVAREEFQEMTPQEQVEFIQQQQQEQSFNPESFAVEEVPGQEIHGIFDKIPRKHKDGRKRKNKEITLW